MISIESYTESYNMPGDKPITYHPLFAILTDWITSYCVVGGRNVFPSQGRTATTNERWQKSESQMAKRKGIVKTKSEKWITVYEDDKFCHALPHGSTEHGLSTS